MLSSSWTICMLLSMENILCPSLVIIMLHCVIMMKMKGVLFSFNTFMEWPYNQIRIKLLQVQFKFSAVSLYC
jgi:hypothetical protein